MTRQQQAFDYFVGMGWTPAQSAGIVANLVAESNLDPAAVGDGGQARGIAQWHPPRQENFRALIGRDIRGSSFEDQLAFVHAELNGTEKYAGEALRACTSAAMAGASVSMLYERPADRDGEAAKRAKLAEAILATAQNDAGATISPSDVPTPQPPEKKPMLPILLGPILEMIPGLIAALGKGERAQTNAKAATVLVEAFTKAVPGAVNAQDAIEKATADPAVREAAKAQVLADPAVTALMEVGGGVAEARKANVALVAGADRWWKLVFNPVLLVTVITLPLVYIIVWRLVAYMDKVSADVIAQTIGTVIGLVLGSVMGFWMGQTYTQGQQRRQTDAANQGANNG